MRKDFEKRKFTFNQIFPMTSPQHKIFTRCAVPVLRSVTSGYNGCILAYGQTGTGKTHTILGKRDGLLPKCLEFLFEEKKQAEDEFIIEMSCIQIYMEQVPNFF